MSNKQGKSLKYNDSLIETRNTIKVNYDFNPEKIQRIKSGIINTSFFVFGNKGSFVFRVYKLNYKKNKDIENELLICKKLKDKGLPVPGVYSSIKNSKITKFKSNDQVWLGVMFECLPGRHIEPSDKIAINEVSKFHAQMHLFLQKENTSKTNDFVKNLIGLIKSEFTLAAKKLKSKKENDTLIALSDITYQVVDELEKNIKTTYSLPKGYCHLDYDSSNILIDSKKISGIIDFDDIEVAPFIADVAFSLWWWLFFNDFDQAIFNQYLKSYQKVRMINKNELKYFYLFLRARNIFLASILFTNQKKIDIANIKKTILFDSWIKDKHEKYSIS